jgi:hypothetical protein
MLLKGMKKRIMMLEQQLEYIKECSQWMKMNLALLTPVEEAPSAQAKGTSRAPTAKSPDA